MSGGSSFSELETKGLPVFNIIYETYVKSKTLQHFMSFYGFSK